MPDLEQILAPLFGIDPVTEQEFLRILAQLHRIDPRDAELVDALVPGASEALDRGTVMAIIRADISETEGKSRVAEARARFRRYLPLLPTLFRYLRLEERSDALNVVHRIDDCVYDVPSISGSGRRDANRRRVLKELVAARDKLREVEAILDRLRHLVGYEFDNIKDAHDEAAVPIGGWSPPSYRVEDLRDGMRYLRAATDIKRALIEDGEDAYFIGDNQVKLHVVDCAYDLTRIYGGPPLVTTPGSDFSFVCSLIYEMATGKRDESMAGAINRFAKSEKRREADEYDREYANEWDPNAWQDNFRGAQATMKRYRAEAAKYGPFVHDHRLDDEARYAALLLVRRAIERAEAASEEVGPFLLWVEQYSELDREAMAQSPRELTEAQRAVDVRLGELRRRGLKFGLRESGY